MTVTKATLSAALPSLTLEMEDRKRSLISDVEDLAPSRKRLKDENGASMKMSEDKEKEVEDYQKDAIIRQMKEYRRQNKDLESQLGDLSKKATYHNDHLRIVDGWLQQLLDEIRLLAEDSLPTPPPSATSTTGEELCKSALLFEDNESFSEHLAARSHDIKNAISILFGRLPSASPDVEELRKRLNELLAKEKEHTVELRRAIDEKDSMYERLEQAMGRYMTAERKLDRAKSTQVLKLERQAMGGSGDTSSPTVSKAAATPKTERSEANGELENGFVNAEAEAARAEATAAAKKQREQLAEIETENERLTNELSAARTKLFSLSDEDYAETALFKSLKSQFEDVIKRKNDLEITNAQLREEMQRLQAERTSYRNAMDEENRIQTSDIEAANARAETDLARIRHIRDQLTSDIALLKSEKVDSQASSARTRELAEAKDERIAALELQVQRLEEQLSGAGSSAQELDGLDMDELKTKVTTLTSQYELLRNELPSMEAAWRKSQALATRKVEEIAGWEESVAKLSAEKAKADQKYFAAMKAKDTREAELRTLKQQSARSSEIITQLKDGEARTKELCINFERQLAEAKDSLAKLEARIRVLEQQLKEATITGDGLKKTVEELKALIVTKDKDNLTAAKAKRQAEEDLEKCKARLEDSRKQYETLRKSRAAVSAADSDDWRKVAICPVCNANIRNTVLKLCGHVFCGSCVKDLISNRSRKCPSCGRGFGANDSMPIVLT